MSTLNGYEKFEKLMADFIPKFVEPIAKQKLEDPSFFSTQNDMEFIIFNGFSEISSSLDTLRLIELFIKTNPPKENGINYSNYLTYHVHNYLQEMYILKERLKTYSKKIQRKYNKVIDEEVLKATVESLMKIVLEALNCITGDGGVRNLHVHSEKFKDDELNWLSSTTFLANFHDEFKIQSEIAYETAKNKWQNTVENNNKELSKLIDIYFNTIYTIISIDDKVILPEEYTKTSNKSLEEERVTPASV
ncbi:MAG TPA: hypothetical protein EYG89_02200 [Bacteroidia bacterium]|nr:hypothetical protein [Bacteroidia bacterium]